MSSYAQSIFIYGLFIIIQCILYIQLCLEKDVHNYTMYSRYSQIWRRLYIIIKCTLGTARSGGGLYIIIPCTLGTAISGRVCTLQFTLGTAMSGGGCT